MISTSQTVLQCRFETKIKQTNKQIKQTNKTVSVSVAVAAQDSCNVKSLLRSTNSFVIGVIVSSLSSSWTGQGLSVNGPTRTRLPKDRSSSRCIKEKSGTGFFSLRKPWMRAWYRRRSQIRLIARLQSGHGTGKSSSGSTTQRLSLNECPSMPLDHCQGIRDLCPLMPLDTHWRHTCKKKANTDARWLDKCKMQTTMDRHCNEYRL